MKCIQTHIQVLDYFNCFEIRTKIFNAGNYYISLADLEVHVCIYEYKGMTCLYLSINFGRINANEYV